MMQKLIAKADVLIEALPYIQTFHNAVVLVKFGGSAMEVPEVTRSVLKDIVFMASAGMKPIVVHGGGKAINAELARQEIPTKFVNGLRYTCDRTIRVVDDVLHNTVNAELVRILAEYGAEPAPVSGKNVLRGQRITTKDKETGEELDIGHVGKVVNVDTPQIQWLLERGRIPVIAPLACDMDGRVYNVNADMAACVIAAEMKVRKLVFLSDVPGVLDKQGVLQPRLTRADIDAFKADGTITGGMIPKVDACLNALDHGCRRALILNGSESGALKRYLVDGEPLGTVVEN